MKKIILSAFAICSFFAASAQCNPSDWDFGAVEYGVYPDTTVGLAQACLNEQYDETIWFLVPTDPGALDPTFGGFGATIQSITLVGASYNGNVDISNLGLSLECNPTNCTFVGGGQYCGVVSGIPNQAGAFPVSLNVMATISSILGELEVPFSFPGYVFTVEDCANPNGVEEVQSVFELGAASPNPANNIARVPFTLSSNDKVDFTMVNMVGERIISKSVAGKRGENSLTIDVANLPAGIYLYTIQSGNYKSTRKMVVQH
jgi:hypothetical protein